jgi:predicted MFS family arabinose efflux permease
MINISILCLISIANFALNCYLLLLAPVLADLATVKIHLEESTIGLLLAAFPFSIMITSMIVKATTDVFNAKNTLVLSLVFAMLSSFCYQSLYMITDRTIFICVCLLGRFLQGF